MKKKKSLPDTTEEFITYRLEGFSILRFNLVEPLADITSDFNIQKLKLQSNVEFNYNLDENRFQVFLNAAYLYELNGNDIQLLNFILRTDFKIQDMGSIIKIEDDKFKLPDDLLLAFVSLTYSTARGIVFAKTQGSFLNEFILPVIDPKSLIK